MSFIAFNITAEEAPLDTPTSNIFLGFVCLIMPLMNCRCFLLI